MNGHSDGLREVTYRDQDGRLWARKIPHGAPDSEAEYGIPIGPLPLDAISLPAPADFLVQLHNQLFHRRIFSLEDLRRRRGDVASAIAAALRLDVETIANSWNATVEKV